MIRYFKDGDSVFAVESGQEQIIKNGWIEISQDEASELSKDAAPLSIRELHNKAMGVS